MIKGMMGHYPFMYDKCINSSANNEFGVLVRNSETGETDDDNDQSSIIIKNDKDFSLREKDKYKKLK